MYSRTRCLPHPRVGKMPCGRCGRTATVCCVQRGGGSVLFTSFSVRKATHRACTGATEDGTALLDTAHFGLPPAAALTAAHTRPEHPERGQGCLPLFRGTRRLKGGHAAPSPPGGALPFVIAPWSALTLPVGGHRTGPPPPASSGG